MESKEMVRLACEAMEDKKAHRSWLLAAFTMQSTSISVMLCFWMRKVPAVGFNSFLIYSITKAR